MVRKHDSLYEKQKLPKRNGKTKCEKSCPAPFSNYVAGRVCTATYYRNTLADDGDRLDRGLGLFISTPEDDRSETRQYNGFGLMAVYKICSAFARYIQKCDHFRKMPGRWLLHYNRPIDQEKIVFETENESAVLGA